MRDTLTRYYRTTLIRSYSSITTRRPSVVSINNGTFYRRQPVLHPTAEETLTNRPLFSRLNFTIPADNVNDEFWAVVGPSNAGKTTFLEILGGQHLCYPPNARSYPYLSTEEVAAKDHGLRHPSRAIQYVGFNGKERGLSGFGNYLSARYESRREASDFSLRDYLQGNLSLNSGEVKMIDEEHLSSVLTELALENLVEMPVSNLSNGQTRRARIAKAILERPELLLLDEPFMGLDPPTVSNLSPLLHKLAQAKTPRLLLALRPQDPIPGWITHVLFLGKDLEITHRGPKQEVGKKLQDDVEKVQKESQTGQYMTELPRFYNEFGQSLEKGSRDKRTIAALRRELDSTQSIQACMQDSEPIVEMDGVTVKYGTKTIIGNWHQVNPDCKNNKEGLYWTVRRGERWGVFGANGSGKTTLIAMITSDHPQAYSQPLKLFGRSRLPSRGTPGISVFELQSRIGHSSPEVHAFFPRSLSVRATIESAYADTPLARPVGLTAEADRRVDACLRWFQGELNPALGMNELLKEETLRNERSGRAEYVQEGNPSTFQDASRHYWFEHDTKQSESVEWADNMLFGALPFSAQRLALFLRAIVKAPDLIVLDEAFSGMDEFLRDKCLLFLEKGESQRLSQFKVSTYEPNPRGWTPRRRGIKDMRDAAIPEGLTDRQALICISHVKEEVPSSVRNWMYLPEGGSNKPVRMGKFNMIISSRSGLWEAIWGM